MRLSYRRPGPKSLSESFIVLLYLRVRYPQMLSSYDLGVYKARVQDETLKKKIGVSEGVCISSTYETMLWLKSTGYRGKDRYGFGTIRKLSQIRAVKHPTGQRVQPHQSDFFDRSGLGYHKVSPIPGTPSQLGS